MSAFYPGAGLVFSPVILFPEIKTWYYLDSQPASEFGSKISPGFELYKINLYYFHNIIISFWILPFISNWITKHRNI